MCFAECNGGQLCVSNFRVSISSKLLIFVALAITTAMFICFPWMLIELYRVTVTVLCLCTSFKGKMGHPV